MQRTGPINSQTNTRTTFSNILTRYVLYILKNERKQSEILEKIFFFFLHFQFAKPDFDLPPLEDIFEFSTEPHGNYETGTEDSITGSSRMQYPFLSRNRKQTPSTLPPAPYVPKFVKEMLAKAFLKDPDSYLRRYAIKD